MANRRGPFYFEADARRGFEGGCASWAGKSYEHPVAEIVTASYRLGRDISTASRTKSGRLRAPSFCRSR